MHLIADMRNREHVELGLMLAVDTCIVKLLHKVDYILKYVLHKTLSQMYTAQTANIIGDFSMSRSAALFG